MDSFQNPVGNHPRDPYEHYKVEPVEGEKKTKDDAPRPFAEEELPKKNISLASQILLFFRRMLDFFETKQGKGTVKTVEEKITEDLLGLKESFNILKKEDRSQDTDFL